MGIEFSRHRNLSGFDYKTCKAVPRIATDGERVLMIYGDLVLDGIDVMYYDHICESRDGGATFSEPRDLDELSTVFSDGYALAYSLHPFYNKKSRRFFGITFESHYKDGKIYYGEDGLTPRRIGYCEYDVKSGRFGEIIPFDFPEGYLEPTFMGQIVELDSGEILLPFYCFRGKKGRYGSIVLRCAIENGALSLRAVGDFISDENFDYSPYDFAPDQGFGVWGRGVYEPSLTEYRGRYYITLRNDLVGLFATSEDGLHFGEIKPYRWDDGSVLENYNTQQRWVRLGDELFLAYTRITPHNHHVTRNRAPIFMARFDTERECLVRDSELLLVPELGARLGNFSAISLSESEALLATAEWMQGPKGPRGCASYGSDNTIWTVKIKKGD